jgi:hypothetical protein
MKHGVDINTHSQWKHSGKARAACGRVMDYCHRVICPAYLETRHLLEILPTKHVEEVVRASR